MLLVLMSISAMANNVIPGMAVTYVRSTGEYVSATIIGPSRHGDNYTPPPPCNSRAVGFEPGTSAAGIQGASTEARGTSPEI